MSEGYVTWSVCVSVCVREIWHYRHQAGMRAIPTASARQARENVCVASASELEKLPLCTKDTISSLLGEQLSVLMLFIAMGLLAMILADHIHIHFVHHFMQEN